MSAEIYIVLEYDRNAGICREGRENSYLLQANIYVIAFAWARFFFFFFGFLLSVATNVFAIKFGAL